MISYDSYLNRIQKLAKAKSFFHKFRFLFIGVFSLIIAATAGLLIAKGTVTTAMTLPATIEYGTPYAPTPASAFMSSVSYEYSLEGSGEWSSEKPIKAGKYLARTVTQKTVGKGYSDPVHFEITPLDVTFTIGATSVVYGETPANCKISKTVYNQTLSLGDLVFEYESYTQKTTNVFVDRNSVKITDGTGEDYTFCYNISFESVQDGVELEILPRAITLQADSITQTYSGGEVKIENKVSANSLAYLANGDKITVENGVFDASGTEILQPKNSGTYSIKVKSYKIMHGTDDVTMHYSVETLNALLNINKRQITITTGSGEKVYDGKELSNPDITQDGGLIGGHIISAQGEYASILDAGEIANINSFKIFDGADDVSENYNIKLLYGTLKVSKRAITVKTGDADREYDGAELFNYDYQITIGSIAEGQRAETNSYGIFNVRESGNNLLALTVFDGNENDVTRNYVIAYIYGTLTLTRRNITISTYSDEMEYNGVALSNSGHLILQGTLVDGHREWHTNTVSIRDAGSVKNELKYVIYADYIEDVTDNYNITYDYGTLTVTPRPIVVITGTPADFIFDGEKHSYEGYDTAYAKDESTKGLLYRDTLEVSERAEIRDVGETANELKFYENSNYIITRTDWGTLKVAPRPITVVTASQDWVYDGQSHSNSSFTTHLYGNINGFGLLDEDKDKLALLECASIVRVGYVSNTCTGIELTSDNYEIKSVSYGTLTVLRRDLTIALPDQTMKYGITFEYPYECMFFGTQGLVPGERVKVFVLFAGALPGEINPAGTYTITLDRVNTKIYDKEGGDSLGNYDITCVDATLTIENRLITVTTGDAQKEYDGMPLSTEDFTVSGTLAEGQYVEIALKREITNVAETGEGNNTTTVVIYDGDGNDVTENYDVKYNFGTLTVTPRQLAVTTGTDKWIYDAEEHSYTRHTVEHAVSSGVAGKGLILDGEELILVSATTIKDVGEKDNICVFEVPNSNYQIAEGGYTYGKLKVTPRRIVVFTPDGEWVYDGVEHYNYKDYKTFHGGDDGLLNGDELTVISYTKITHVGDGSGVQNICEYAVPNSNYEIREGSYSYGTLKITPRPIVVVTGSAQKEYDGTPLGCTDYQTYLFGDENQPGLIAGDGARLSYTKITTIVDVGSKDNVCEFQATSTDYEIKDYIYGTLTVTPKAVTVVISQLESITYGETFEYPSGLGNYERAEGLVNGEQLQIAVYYMLNGERLVPKIASEYYEVVLDIENTLVYDKNSEEIENGISNYSITAENIRAEIQPKKIGFKIIDAEITYGEGDDFEPQYIFDIAPEDMPYGEEIRISFVYLYYLDLEWYANPYHVGEYKIQWGDFEGNSTTVYLDGVEVVNGQYNYEITLKPVTVTVTVNPKEITVELLDVLSVYGDPIEYPSSYQGNYKNELDLPYGDTITVFVKDIQELLPVGIHYGYIQADEEKTLVNGVADTSDYKIEYINGDLEVVKRSIIVINLGAEKVYDGTPLTNGEYTTRTVGSSSAGLLGDDILTLSGELVSITNVWESGTLNANRYQDPENYEIVGYEDGELIITPKSIVIEISDVEDVTYGETFNYPTGKNNFKNADTCGLANGEQLLIAVCYYYCVPVDFNGYYYEYDLVKVEGQPKNAGKYQISLDIENTLVYDENSEEIEDGIYNYDITSVNADAFMRYKSIEVAFESAEITYGEGEDFIPEYSFDILPEDMPYGEEIRFSFSYRYLWYVDNYNDIVELTDFPKHSGAYEIYWKDGAVVYKDGVEVKDGIDNYLVYLSGYEPTVTVKPKEITVELLDIGDIEYGDAFEYPSYEGNFKNGDSINLPYGDAITVFATPIEELLSVGVYYGYIQADEAKTLVNGIADTSDYEIEFIGGNLEVVKRRILVINDGAEKVYDGTPLENHTYFTCRELSYKFGPGILPGDDVTLELWDGTTYVSITNVWESGTKNQNRYKDTENYAVKGYISYALVITPRIIHVASEDEVIEYDGNYHSPSSVLDGENSYHINADGEREPALISALGHRFVMGEPDRIKDVGSIPQTSFRNTGIFDGEGNDVTENYSIASETLGKLTIIPRSIWVIVNGDSKYYDGQPLTQDTYLTIYQNNDLEEGLIGDDELVLVGELTYVTYVWEGRVTNEVEFESPVGEYGYANYEITHFVRGTLQILARAITVEIDDKEMEYAGYPYNFGDSEDNYDNPDECDLADGEKLHIEVNYVDEEGNIVPVTEKFNTGTYKIWLDLSNCVIYKDGEVLEHGIKNYKITYYTATLTVNPRKVTITQSDIEAVYGDEIIYNGYEGGEDIPYYMGVQDKLTFNYSYYYQDENGELVLLPERVKVGEYIVKVDEDSVLVNGENPYNYEFEFIDGTLTVTPKEVDIILKAQTVIYGDEFIYPDGADSYEALDLPYGDTLEVFIKALAEGKLNAGRYLDYIEADEEQTLVNGVADTSDYIFNYVSGTLLVDRRGITVKLIKPDREYTYGEIYSYPTGIGNYESVENLVYGEQLEVAFLYHKNGEYFTEPKNAGNYEVILSELIIYDEFGDLIDNNYYVVDIDSVAVPLTVERKHIWVLIDDSEYIYGFEAPEITFSIYVYWEFSKKIELPFGEILSFDYLYYSALGGRGFFTPPEDAGEYYVYGTDALAYINGEKEGVDNYIITAPRATLTIHKRQIVVETATSSHRYDGNPYSDPNVYAYFYDENDPDDRSIGGFVNGYLPEIDWESVPTVTNVSEGRVENKFNIILSQNYEIFGEIECGEIWITSRSLYIELYDDLSIIYGEEFVYPSGVGNYKYQEGLIDGESLEVVAYLNAEKQVPDVGLHEVVGISGETLINGVNDCSNYEITIISGWLEIRMREIYIISASEVIEYDGQYHSPSITWDGDHSYHVNNDGEIEPALVSGHRFEVIAIDRIKDVGTIPNGSLKNNRIFDEEGNDVTDNYAIVAENSGTLTIIPRTVKVTTYNQTNIYDGSFLIGEFEVTHAYDPEKEGIVAGDWELIAIIYTSIVNVWESGVLNKPSFVFPEGEFGNVNYEIVEENCTYGTLEVTKKQITIEIGDKTKEYDGIYYVFEDGENVYTDGLAEGESLYIAIAFENKDGTPVQRFNAGEYTIYLDRAGSTVYKNGYAITKGVENYEIFCQSANLTVTKMDVTVYINDVSAIYGNEIIFEGFETDRPLPSYAGVEKLTFTYHFEDVSGETLSGRLNVGSYFICADADSAEILGGNIDNYNIQFVSGTLEIITRYLILATESAEKVYDGTPLSWEGINVWLYEDGLTEGLLEGDSFTLTDWAQIVEVGEILNTCVFEVPKPNYEVLVVRNGTLTVTPAELKIVLNDVESVNYGERLVYPTENGGYESVEGLFEGQTLTVDVYYMDVDGNIVTPRNAGGYTVHVDLENSKVEGTVNGLGNYFVSYEPKTAIINRLKVTIALEDIEREYDSSAREYDEGAYTIVDGNTVYGEFFNVFVTYFKDGVQLYGAPKDAGEYQIKLDTDNCLVNGGYMNANLNYILECEEEFYNYVITRAKFSVTLGPEPAEVVYYGEVFDYNMSGGFTVEGLKGTDQIECNVKYYQDGVETKPKNAGIYEVVFDTDNIVFLYGDASNYIFDDTAGNYISTLIIHKRSIRVTVANREIEYEVEVRPEDESYTAVLTYDGYEVYGSAFATSDDEAAAGAVFSYKDANGMSMQGVPFEVGGLYYITVEFINEEITKNYEIEVIDGRLTVTGRKVLVTPAYTGGIRTYNGYAVDVDELVRDGILYPEHIHYIENAAEDDRYGFTPEDFEKLTFVYEFENADSGEYFANGKSPQNAGYYYIYIKVYGVDESRYAYETTRRLDYFIISPAIIDVTYISSLTKEYDKTNSADIRIESGGFLGVDAETCKTAPDYIVKTTGESATYLNAGEYYVGAKVVGPGGANNYTINYRCEKGTLIITQITLYIKPVSKADYYQGNNLALSKTDYLFVDKENGRYTNLLAGDELYIEPSTQLEPTRTSVTVTISGVSVYDRTRRVYTTQNYDIKYAYERSMGTGYSANDFKGTLEFKMRTVYYRQIVPAGQSAFTYDGEVKQITGNNLFEIVSGKGEGLYTADRLTVASASIGPQVGKYYNWLNLSVWDTRNNRDVSRVYNLVLENAEESYITIDLLQATVKINSSLTVNMLEDNRALFSATLFEGRLVLVKRYYEVDGIKTELNHEYEIIAIKSKGVWNFALVIFERKSSGSLTDRSDSYNVNFIKDSTLEVECKVVECHSLTSIPSDIYLTIKLSYDMLIAGEALASYEGRPALTSSQYEVKGLLLDHIVSQISVYRSNGKLTFVVLITNGRSDRSYYYNLMCELPDDYPAGEVAAVLASSFTEIPQDVNLSITADLNSILAGRGLTKTYDARLVLDGGYTVEGLLNGHTVQIFPMMVGGKVTLAVFIFEAKFTNGAMSGRSDRSYYYNLVVESAPTGADVMLIASLNDLTTDIKITLSSSVTVQNLKNGVGVTKSAIDGRSILDSSAYSLVNYFGASPLASNHFVEIVVERDGDNFKLYAVVYQLSSSGKRSDRSYLYSLTAENVQNGITVSYINTAELGNAGLN